MGQIVYFSRFTAVYLSFAPRPGMAWPVMPYQYCEYYPFSTGPIPKLLYTINCKCLLANDQKKTFINVFFYESFPIEQNECIGFITICQQISRLL